MSRVTPAQLGHPLAGRYELGERIGAGGFGEVRVAVDHSTGARVAVKLLADASRESAARFAREARLIRQLTHPNTVRLLDFGQTDAGPFLVLELLRGETLSARLKRGPVTADVSRHVVEGILASLAEAHALGIVHRDVKPANVFLCDALPGALPAVKVLDFGIARDPHSAGATVELAALGAGGAVAVQGPGPGLTQADALLGTPRYMAPEQIMGGAITPATDVYAAGLIFAELLTGRAVFAGWSDLTTVLSKGAGARVPLSPEVERSPYGGIIAIATDVLAARRFSSAGEMLRALSLVVTPRKSSRSSLLKWGAAAIAACALGAVVTVAATWDDPAPAGRESDDAADKDEKKKRKREKKKAKEKRDEQDEQPAETSAPAPPKPPGPGKRSLLGPRTVLYEGPLDLPRPDLAARLIKAGFTIDEEDGPLIRATRAGTMCFGIRAAAPGPAECLRVQELQDAPDRTWLLVCHADGFHLLKCHHMEHPPVDPEPTLRAFGRVYGLDPDKELAPP